MARGSRGAKHEPYSSYRKTSGIFPTGDINKADEKTSLLFSMALWRNFRRSFFLKISQNYLTTGHLRLCHLTSSSSRTFMSIKLGPSLQTYDDLRPLYELPELTKMTFLRLDTIKIRSSRQKNLYFTWVSFDHHYNWRRKSSESFFIMKVVCHLRQVLTAYVKRHLTRYTHVLYGPNAKIVWSTRSQLTSPLRVSLIATTKQ